MKYEKNLKSKSSQRNIKKNKEAGRMARKKKQIVGSNLSVSASGGYVAGANVEGQEGTTPAGLVNTQSEGLVSAAAPSATTPQPTELKAGLTAAEVQAQIDTKLEAAAQLKAQKVEKATLKADLAKIECGDDAEAKALVAQAEAQIEAGQEVHAGLVNADVTLCLARSTRAVPNIQMNHAINNANKADSLSAALCSSYGVDPVKAGFDGPTIEAGNKLGFMSIKALAHHGNILAGGTGLSSIAGEREIVAALSTANVANMVANLGNKFAAERFDNSDAVQIVRQFTKKKTVNDFKTNTGVRLGVDGKFKKLAEGEEIPLGTLSDAKYTYGADMHGRRFGITRQMRINDDLGLLMDLMNEMIMGGEDALVDSFLATLADTDFFKAGNNNLDTSGAIPSEAGYTLMDTKFAAFTRDNGRLAGIKAKNILVPSALQTAAKKMFVSTEIRDTTASKSTAIANVFQGSYNPATLAELAAADEWYGFTDPQRIPAIVASYLYGNERPTIMPAVESVVDLSQMVVGYFDFGMDAAMPQGAIKFTN
jgi:hypothetical protein